MHRTGYTRRPLARATEIHPERLGRLLCGERWIALPEIVALGMTLEIDLIRDAYPACRQQAHEVKRHLARAAWNRSARRRRMGRLI